MELPAWLAGLDSEEPAKSSEPAGEPSADELPAWLQAEIEPEPEARQPANPADWHPAQPKPVEVQPSASELRPEHIEPQVPVVPAPQPAAEVQQPIGYAEAGPVQPAEPMREEIPVPVSEVKSPAEEKPAPVPEAVQAEAQAPIQQPAPSPARPKPPAAAKAPLPSIGDAQVQLGHGNIAAALDIYSKLIRKGKSLEDIIRDLRDALYRYPVEVPLWQSLGDAYMRANRLQEALDAYTKAEELLR